MPGHVFVVNSDITKLRCDAWLCPVGDERNGSGTFIPVDRVRQVKDRWTLRDRVYLMEPADRHGGPAVWLGDVVTFSIDEVLAAFVEAAIDADLGPQGRRLRLATPLLKTGLGGWRGMKDEAVKQVLASLYRLADEHDIDLVLVTWGDQDFAAVQHRRRELELVSSKRAWDLGPYSDQLIALADRLGGQAKLGRLVGFVGAGVSRGAGLPLWQQLIDVIAGELGGIDLDELHDLDLRDQATVLARHAKERDLPAMLAEQLESQHFGLAHALLASLPIDEWITTNFDTLFEMALRTAGRGITIIPGGTPDDPAASDRWLLKLHGSIGSDAGMVLSRVDYLDASNRWAALFGLVQGLLLTKHMLFVGYSLSDEDFHGLTHQVQQAKGHEAGTFGTALALGESSGLEQLWGDKVDIAPMQPGPQSVDTEQRARVLDIFLDRLAFTACDGRSFLLAETYGDLLSKEERQLAALVRELRDLTRASKALGGDVTMQRFLRHFGVKGIG